MRPVAPLPVPVIVSSEVRVSTVAQLAEIPEEEIWLAKQKSPRTRRAYRLDVRHFMRALGHHRDRPATRCRSPRRHRVGTDAARAARRSGIDHSPPPRCTIQLVQASCETRGASRNPVVDVERPTINREEGSTAAFSKAQARKLLDAPPSDTIAGLRDRAILSVGLQVGFRRAEIAALNVGDLHQNRGFDALRVIRKGGRRDALAINPQTAQRIRAYLELPGTGRSTTRRCSGPCAAIKSRSIRAGRMDPDAIDRVVRKYAAEIGLVRGYSAHSMRATFITTALENGAQLEDVQKAAGHRDPSTTKLYDRRGYNPEKAASFFATY